MFQICVGPVSWQSRMQTSVALSSIESEYMAASAAAQEALWLNRLLQQLGLRTSNPTVLYEDNKAAILNICYYAISTKSGKFESKKKYPPSETTRYGKRYLCLMV